MIKSDPGLQRIAESRDQERLLQAADFSYVSRGDQGVSDCLPRAIAFGQSLTAAAELHYVAVPVYRIFSAYHLFFLGTAQQVQARLDALPEPGQPAPFLRARKHQVSQETIDQDQLGG